MKTTDQAGASPFPSPEIVALLRDVAMTFDSYTRVLNRVSLEIKCGEVFGLVGEKDSGKSTILRLLAGKLSPTEGEISIFGRSLRWPSVKRRIGHLPQNSGHRHPRTGWLGWFDTVLGWCSGGRSGAASEPFSFRQNRGRLAQVLAGKPELLLLDEPFAGLDLTQRREMTELILSLTQQGRTVILSSRQLSDVSAVCDQIAIVFRGEIQAVGPLAELLALPDAIRVTAPVLPQATTERVLKIICEDLHYDPLPGVARDTSLVESHLQMPTQLAPPDQSAPNVADDLLASLTTVTSPKMPKETPVTAIDSVNHAKLEELTKKPQPSNQ